jgi:hypothetical protein
MTKRVTRTALRQKLRRLAREFAESIVELLERHGMWADSERVEPAEEDKPKRVRRSEATLEIMCGKVLELIRRAREPVAISAISEGLGLAPRDVGHPLRLLVEEGKLRRTGTRRGARYSLATRRTGQAKRGRKKRTFRRATGS